MRYYITVKAHGRILSRYYEAENEAEAVEKAHAEIGYSIEVEPKPLLGIGAVLVQSDEPVIDVANIIERMKVDLAYHQSESDRITEEYLDIDAPNAYSAEEDAAESYHAGRVGAMSDAISLLLGREVRLYSETEEPA